jgi:hypothetical protein
VAAFGHSVAGARWGLVIAFGVSAILCERQRRTLVGQLSDATRALLADDRRARRGRADRWKWEWPTGFRPWWWLLLQRLSPPAALGVNLALTIFGLLTGDLLVLVIFGIGLPFSGWRTWKDWRRRHPGRGSWCPPAS